MIQTQIDGQNIFVGKYMIENIKLQGQCVEKRLPFIAFYHESIQKAIKFL